jgi:putative ATP-dependent endonuclease of OLD family
MQLISVTIQNFRCYKEENTVSISSLTTFVGKNDIGKSTILEALEVFFNSQSIKCEQGDKNIYSNDNDVIITCEFDDLPTTLSVDAGAVTSLAHEFLLSKDNTLKIKKVFDCSKKTPTVEIFIIANHPTAKGVENLLELKEKELQTIIKEKGLDVALKGNPIMRDAIWKSAGDLKLSEIEIAVSKPKEDSKRIWEQIESYLPIYALFQSDRNSQDSDGEVQNPMKVAIATAIAEVQDDIDRIQKRVKEKAEEIARNTHVALQSIDPKLANKLVPQFNPPTTAKWTGLFSISMDTDDGIPLNKRGSGIRRMILVSLFKAEAERRLVASNKRSIIYALEEPETAQHPSNQKILIDSFKALSVQEGCQVILTTHSPGLAGELPVDSIRFVKRNEYDKPVIESGINVFGEVAKVLGVIPDSRVKVLLCLEGPTDVIAMKCLSKALHDYDKMYPDLFSDSRVAVITLGGSTLQHWVSEHYLKNLGRPEIHIYDGDVKSYQNSIDKVNARTDGSWGVLCLKHEIECYLHADAIYDSQGVRIEVVDAPGPDGKSVPRIFAEVFSAKNKFDGVMKDNTAKTYLSHAFHEMNYKRLMERDPSGEVIGWFSKIASMIN